MIDKQPGGLRSMKPTKQEAYDERVAAITDCHREAIQKRWKYLSENGIPPVIGEVEPKEDLV